MLLAKDKLLIVNSDRFVGIRRDYERADSRQRPCIESNGELLVPSKLAGLLPPNHLIRYCTRICGSADEVVNKCVVEQWSLNVWKPIMVRSRVRGYIIGSGWKDYQETSAICGIQLPAGLPQAAKLETPIFYACSES